jgi:iron complex outermembrane receptor protein
MKGHSVRIAMLCGSLASPLLPSAWSQGAPTPVTPVSKEEVVSLPAFTITETQANPYVSKQALSGTRVAMSIIDMPQTVSVVTSEFIQDSMAFRMLDAAKYVTPVVESTLPVGGDRYTIRGFQVSHEFIDGMVISGEDGYSMSLAPYNIERIEIIKGPNAILVPGGAPGGQFNPITKSPLMNNQQSATLEFSQYFGNAISTDINRVVSKERGMAVRFVAAYWNSEGYQKNSFRRGYEFAPSFSWQISPRNKFTIKGEFVQNREIPGFNQPVDPSVGSDNYATIARGLPRDWSFSGGEDYDHRHRRTDRVTAELLSTLTDHITSRLMISGDHVLREDQGGTSASIFMTDPITGVFGAFNPTRNPFTGKYEPGVKWTIDTTSPAAIASTTALVSSAAAPMPDPSTWVYRRINNSDHLYYTEAHLRNDYAGKFETEWFKSTTVAGFAANYSRTKWKSFIGVSQGPDVPNNNLNSITYIPLVYPEPSPVIGGSNKTAKLHESQFYIFESAGFLQDRLLLSGGVSRYFGKLERTDNSGVGAIGNRELKIVSNATSLGVTVKPIKPVALFWGHNTSGESMPGSLSAGNPGLKPNAGKQDEYGIKTSLLNDTLTLSWAHFTIEQTNFAVPNSEYYVLVSQGNQAAANALPTSTFADVSSKGWEIEGSYVVNRNVTLIGNYSDYKIRQPTGVRFRGTPDKIYGLYTDYRFTEGVLNGFGFNVGIDYKSDMVGENASGYTTAKPLVGVPTVAGVAPGFVPNQATYKYAGRTLINLGFTYRAKEWTARLQIENVTDKDYVKASGSRTALVEGDPRFVKGSVTYRF